MTVNPNSLTRCEQVREILWGDFGYHLTHVGALLVDCHSEEIVALEVATSIVVLTMAMEIKLELVNDRPSLDSQSRRGEHALQIIEMLSERRDSGLIDGETYQEYVVPLWIMISAHDPKTFKKAERMVEMVLRSHPYYDDEGTYLQGTLAISRFPHETNFEEEDGA